MREPVKIVDVARQMIEMSGRDIQIVYIGLRPGEKMVPSHIALHTSSRLGCN
jgi:dTDP-glucose 4,6-dehydratase